MEVSSAIFAMVNFNSLLLKFKNKKGYGCISSQLERYLRTAVRPSLALICYLALIIKVFISLTALDKPIKTAREIILWPIFSSFTTGIAAIGWTL